MTNARNARSAREKAAELRAHSARQEARRRALVLSASIAAVLFVLVAAGIIVQMARKDSIAASGTTPPRNLINDSYVVGQAEAPVTLTVYEDFICPGCASFEAATASLVKGWIAAGTVKVEYRPIAILDHQSTTDYSSRATNATAAVNDLAPKSFQAFHDALFAAQPAEGGPGLPDSKLIELAVTAGAPKAAITQAITDRSFRGWVAAYAEKASKAGVSSTPTILINGKDAGRISDLASFKKLVEDAQKAAKK